MTDLTLADILQERAPEAAANFKYGIPQSGTWARLFGPQAEDFIRRAITYAPMGVRSAAGAIKGNDAVTAHRLYKANPYETPADVHARLSRMPQGAERDALMAQSAGQQARFNKAMAAAIEIGGLRRDLTKLRGMLYEPNEPANMRGDFGDVPGSVPPRLDPWAPGMRAAGDIPRNMRVGGGRSDPANYNPDPVLTARYRAALESKPDPYAQAQRDQAMAAELKKAEEHLRRKGLLEAVRTTGYPVDRAPARSPFRVIDGGKPPSGLFPKD